MSRLIRNLAMICMTVSASLASAADAAPPGPTYLVKITLSQKVGGKSQVLSNPTVTVREAQPASVSVDGGANVYTFHVQVDRQDEKVVAMTKTKIIVNNKVIGEPKISQFVGQAASLEVGDLNIAVEVQNAKGGA